MTGESVRLGLMPPLTGLVSLYGEEISRAGQIACDEINERGGVLGRPLVLIIEDDGSLPETAVPAAERLVGEHGCVAIIGNLLSNSRISVASRVAEPRRIPYLNFSFSEGSIYSRYFFHFAALPNQQIDHMIPYMARKFGPKIFFAGNNYEWPRGSIDAAKRALLRMGGEVVGEEYFPIGTSDFDALLMAVANSGADVFVPYAAGNDQLELLKQFTARGLKSRMAVVMGHYDEAMVSQLSPEVREGFYSTNTYFMTLDTAANRDYLRRLVQQPGVTGIWPQGNGVLTNFGEGTYLCVHAFAKAANLAGSLDAEALVKALQTIQVSGPQGEVVVDPVTHYASVNTYLSRCDRNGSFEIVERFGSSPPVIPERYRHQIPQVVGNNRRMIALDDEEIEGALIAVADVKTQGAHCCGSIAMITATTDAVAVSVALDRLLQQEDGSIRGAIKERRLLKLSAPLMFDGVSCYAIAVMPLFQADVCSALAIYAAYLDKDGKARVNELQQRRLKVRSELADEDAFSSAIVITVDASQKVEYMNGAARRVWGISETSDYSGMPVSKLFEKVRDVDSILSRLSGKAAWSCLCNITTGENRMIPVEMTVEPRGRAGDGVKSGFMISGKAAGVKVDVPLEYNGDEIFFRADVAIISCDEKGTILQANHSAGDAFGYPPHELMGLSIHLLVPPHFRVQHESYFRAFLLSEDQERSMGMRGEVTGYRKDGAFFPAEVSLSKYESRHGTTVIATLRDITARKKAQENLVWQATHDPLTKLPDRSLIKDRLTNALERSKRSGTSVALMFIDLDSFKLINDSYGHDVGDGFLVTLAERLVEVVRPGDTVARFGGDEFLVLCDQVPDQQLLPALADRIVDAIKVPCEVGGVLFYPTVSIGLAMGDGDSDTADTLLRKADVAMYEVKQHGRDGWRIFDHDIGESTQLYLKLANGLRQAIDKNEFENFYQPIVDIQSRRIVGAESLLRWRFEGSFVPPDKFIPVAEMSGSIVEIGEWVFEQACLQQVCWQRQFGDEAPYMSINISARQLIKEDLVERLKSVMARVQVDPTKIILEITETTLMSDVERSQQVMSELGELGLTFAIDDFGTGYSSLSRIKSLPVSIVKVDKVFVREIESDGSSHAISAAVINMAHALDLKVTAEGVEVSGQLNVLHGMGCNNAQGYLFAKPLPAADILAILEQHRNGYQLPEEVVSKTA